jgi:hypothetical protein
MVAMLYPSRNVAGSTNVPVIAAQVLGKPAMGKSRAMNVFSVKKNAPTSALKTNRRNPKVHLRNSTPKIRERPTISIVLSPGILDLQRCIPTPWRYMLVAIKSHLAHLKDQFTKLVPLLEYWSKFC